MKQELFDSKIKELAESYTEAPSPEVWDRIEAGMDRRRRHRVLLRRVAGWSSAAAVAAGLFSLALLRQPAQTESVMTADAVIVPAGEQEPAVKVSRTDVPDLRPVPRMLAEVHSTAPAELPEIDRNTDRKSRSRHEDIEETSDTVPALRTGQPSIYDRTRDMDYVAMAEAQEVSGTAKSRPSFSVSAGGNLSPTNATGNVDFTGPSYSSGVSGGGSSSSGIVPVSSPKHYFPVSVGAELKYSFLNDRLGIGLGVNYTFLNSRYEALVDRRYQASVDQSVHYIGVPLNLYVTILSSDRLSFYANAGAMMEKAVRVSYEMTDLYAVKYQHDSKAEGVQWSANIGLGVEYRFLDFMGIYVDPRLTYFFDCGQPYSVRTEQPLQFNLEMGFRFHIGA